MIIGEGLKPSAQSGSEKLVLDKNDESKRERWFTVILGAGTFATRAGCEIDALIKSELRAEELRKGKVPIETNGGLPLVMPMNGEDNAFYEAVMYDGKPEADIVGLRSQSPHTSSTEIDEDKQPEPFRPYNPNQGKLFDPYSI